MSFIEAFTVPILNWYEQHGRKNLPWQTEDNAYYVWISEIMLQQTQVKTVIPYFNRFMQYFPTIQKLAEAHEDEVLHLWAGLGYYSRARNLHKTARLIVSHYQGIFPKDPQQLMQLPGIGQSTAHAILAQAYNKPYPILDGNVKRVLSRYFLVDGFSSKTTEQLWKLANDCMSQERARDYTQAIMDFGALYCTHKNPSCHSCPIQANCLAFSLNKVTEYPQKKPKKTIPEKSTTFILLYDAERRIYLTKNPPIGIWGGLWSLMQVESHQDFITKIQQQHGLTIIQQQHLKKFKHTFSHFKLMIEAIALEIKFSGKKLSELPGKWLTQNEINKLGLPKPIYDIIQNFIKLAI